MQLVAISLGSALKWDFASARPEAEWEIKRIIDIPEPLTVYVMMVPGYPEVFERKFNPASGLCFNVWIEGDVKSTKSQGRSPPIWKKPA